MTLNEVNEKPIFEGSYTIQGSNLEEARSEINIDKGTHLKMIVKRDIAT